MHVQVEGLNVSDTEQCVGSTYRPKCYFGFDCSVLLLVSDYRPD